MIYAATRKCRFRLAVLAVNVLENVQNIAQKGNTVDNELSLNKWVGVDRVKAWTQNSFLMKDSFCEEECWKKDIRFSEYQMV